MNKKYLLLVVLVFIIGTILLIYKITKETYSLNEEVMGKDLILKYDNDNLSNNFRNYVDLIDDSLIPIASFVMSDVLSDNYDFLTVFAINYILNNIEDFEEDIYAMDNYIYNNGYITYSTNKYVKKDLIYRITNEVFNKKDYVIINDYLKIDDNMVPLLLIDNYNFDMKIEKILDIINKDDNYVVKVKYSDNDLIYKYIFEKNADRLILKNLEV